MHHPYSGIAVPDLVAQDANADQVVDVVEIAPLDDHLLIDRPVVLGPTLHGRFDFRRAQGGNDLGADLGQIGVAGRRAAGDQAHDLLILLGVQDRERQVFQLPLDAGHAQPMRKGRNDFQRLARLAGLLLRRQEAHGAHVVQSVGHLDHQHPRIAGHRGDHFADRLALGGAAQHHSVQLGHPVDEMADFLAEFLGQRLQRVTGVLDRVVQQRGHQSRSVHAQLGENVGHRQRMGDVGVTGVSQLAGVPLVGDLEGALHHRKVGLGIDLPVHRHQRLEHRIDGSAPGGHPPGQPGPDAARRAAGGLEGLYRRLGRFDNRLDGHWGGFTRWRRNGLRRTLIIRHARHLRPRGYRESPRARPCSGCAAAAARSPRDHPAR